MHNNVFTYRWLAVFTGFAALVLQLDNAKAPLVWAFAGLTGFLLIAEIRRLSKEVCFLERSHADRTVREDVDDIRRSMWQQVDTLHSELEKCSGNVCKAKNRL
jgi:hypothetical protein